MIGLKNVGGRMMPYEIPVEEQKRMDEVLDSLKDLPIETQSIIISRAYTKLRHAVKEKRKSDDDRCQASKE